MDLTAAIRVLQSALANQLRPEHHAAIDQALAEDEVPSEAAPVPAPSDAGDSEVGAPGSDAAAEESPPV